MFGRCVRRTQQTMQILLALHQHSPKCNIMVCCRFLLLVQIMEVDSHIGAAMSGLIADARTLVDHARVEAQNHRFTYDEPMRVEALTQAVCDLALSFGEVRFGFFAAAAVCCCASLLTHVRCAVDCVMCACMCIIRLRVFFACAELLTSLECTPAPNFGQAPCNLCWVDKTCGISSASMTPSPPSTRAFPEPRSFHLPCLCCPCGFGGVSLTFFLCSSVRLPRPPSPCMLVCVGTHLLSSLLNITGGGF